MGLELPLDLWRQGRVEIRPYMPLSASLAGDSHPRGGFERGQQGLGLAGLGDNYGFALRGTVNQRRQVGLGVVETHGLPHERLARHAATLANLTKLVKSQVGPLFALRYSLTS